MRLLKRGRLAVQQHGSSKGIWIRTDERALGAVHFQALGKRKALGAGGHRTDHAGTELQRSRHHIDGVDMFSLAETGAGNVLEDLIHLTREACDPFERTEHVDKRRQIVTAHIKGNAAARQQ